MDAGPSSHHHRGDHGGPGSYADPSANRIYGNDRDNVIQGTELRDVIKAGGGDDDVFGNAGNDTLFGETGDDFLNGGLGNDMVSGGPGNDVLQAGDDGWFNILSGGHGVDTMYGASVNNVIDVFQFAQAEDAPFSYNPNAVVEIHDFRDGEDFIHLAFDAKAFKPGHQGFEFVDEDEAGDAGTIYLDKIAAGSVGDLDWMHVLVHGNTDNDGTPGFTIAVWVHVDPDEIDVSDADAAYQAPSEADFLFG